MLAAARVRAARTFPLPFLFTMVPLLKSSDTMRSCTRETPSLSDTVTRARHHPAHARNDAQRGVSLLQPPEGGWRRQRQRRQGAAAEAMAAAAAHLRPAEAVCLNDAVRHGGDLGAADTCATRTRRVRAERRLASPGHSAAVMRAACACERGARRAWACAELQRSGRVGVGVGRQRRTYCSALLARRRRALAGAAGEVAPSSSRPERAVYSPGPVHRRAGYGGGGWRGER